MTSGVFESLWMDVEGSLHRYTASSLPENYITTKMSL